MAPAAHHNVSVKKLTIPDDQNENPEEHTHPTPEPATVAHKEHAEDVATGSSSVSRDSTERSNIRQLAKKQFRELKYHTTKKNNAM